MFLYKYRPINKNTLAILRKNELFFPNKANLNDPFEFSVLYNAKYSKLLGPLYFSKNAKYLNKNIDHEDAKRKLRSSSIFSHKALYDYGMLVLLEKGIRARVTSAGILCLSSICDSILMWSHYAKEHKGLCLIFDTTKDSRIFSTPMWKVHYNNKFPYQNIFSLNPERKFRTLLTTKSVVWKYEKEYRFIWEPGGRSYPFDSAALIGIIFGCKASSRNKNTVRSILSQESKPVTLYNAVMGKRKYALDIIPE